MRRAGFARLSALSAPPENVRVALLHGVAPDLRGSLQALLERLLEDRNPIGPDELIDRYARAAPWTGGPRIAFSFDDGLLSSYEAAQRVLNPLGLSAAFFIPTRILELRSEGAMRAFRGAYLHAQSAPSRPEEFRVMTRDHLLELARQGHAILPHTHTHKALAAISTPEDVDRELRRPRAIVEDLIQAPAAAFALPYGDDRSVGHYGYEAVTQLYDACFTSVPGLNTERTGRYYLHRDGFDPGDDPGDVDNLLAGTLDVPYRAKMWRLRRRAA